MGGSVIWSISQLRSLGWESLTLGRSELLTVAVDPRAWVDLAAQKGLFLRWRGGTLPRALL